MAAPAWLALNVPLARTLGADPETLRAALDVFAGNAVPSGAEPLAQLYAGHQFGGWSPRLGDGRAVLLGEIVDPGGHRRDIQLKGSGPTPYSRAGDGRAAVGPVVREYIVSEAMHALGVPTTRALAAVRTGQPVWRPEGALPGAVLTRTATSHIRIGTFQAAADSGGKDVLEALVAHTVARHVCAAGKGPLALLRHAVRTQAHLVARWMGLGFVHGVMNTDNTALSGETIDYGPCAFMEAYNPGQVFSSIDRMGRYAWANQPRIALWNLTQLASALLPLWPERARDAGIAAMTGELQRFHALYQAQWARILGAKIGLGPEGAETGRQLLGLMARDGADFTNTFRALGTPRARTLFQDRAAFDAWETAWRRHRPDRGLIEATNPAVIARNHCVEEAVRAAQAGDDRPFHRLCAVLRRPFVETAANLAYRRPARPHETVHQTFCGT